MLHRGAKEVSLNDLACVTTPLPTESWYPVPHLYLVHQVKKSLGRLGYWVFAEVHALGRGGSHYFGLLEVCPLNKEQAPTRSEYGYVMAVRNSHDKIFSAGIAVGSRVFVCDNLAFAGEIQISRRHTKYILQDFPLLTARAVGRLAENWTGMDRRFLAYKERQIVDAEAHDLVLRAFDVRAITLQQIPKVLQEWRNPSHLEFRSRNLWSLFNCFTGVSKGTSLAQLPSRTIALHGLMDSFVGLVRKEQMQNN
jgi:hypothetical protein